MPFEPTYRITPRTATHLMRIEAARQAVDDLPITSSVLAGLRETARLVSTHYSTMIEGNRLTHEEVSSVIERKRHFPGRERDEAEVLGSIVITSRDVEGLFGVSQRTARNILSSWVRSGFVVMSDPAKKTRGYRLSRECEGLASG